MPICKKRERKIIVIYTEKDLCAIEKVKTVFCDYLRQAKGIELLWSDKIGYILFLEIPKDMEEEFGVQPFIIKNAEVLCSYILSDIAYEYIETSPRTCHDPYATSAEEREQIRALYAPYITQLPEYKHLIEAIFIESI